MQNRQPLWIGGALVLAVRLASLSRVGAEGAKSSVKGSPDSAPFAHTCTDTPYTSFADSYHAPGIAR